MRKATIISESAKKRMLKEGIREPFLSVVIPAYNEEKRIAPTLHLVLDYLRAQDYQYEIIIVDDGSSDRTIEQVARVRGKDDSVFLLRNAENKGKGYAVRKGVLNARGKYILFSDADLSTPIQEAEKLIRFLESGYDVVIGSRALRESDIQGHQPWFRELGGRSFNILVRLITVRGIKDTQCGFKCFRHEVSRKIFSRQVVDGFGFDVEVLYLAQKLNYKIKEVPVQWRHSPESKMRLFKDTLRMLRNLFQIRVNDRMGLYDINASSQIAEE